MNESAIAAVDWSTLGLLAGMMIIANILGKTGIFRWLAVEAVRRAQGKPYRLLVLISIITAIASAFLDNVTTVVLMTPVTFFIAQRLDANPAPFLISEILASNIGGTATLIGDPPNIIIGSRLGKDFGDFLVNVGPVAVVALVVYLLFARWLFRHDLAGAERALERDDIARLVAAERRIENVPLMRLGLAVLTATVIGFLLARPLGLEAATIALAGAVVLMILAREDVHEVLREVEWPTLFFFLGLFIVVGALVKSGLISDLAKQALALTGGRTDVAVNINQANSTVRRPYIRQQVTRANDNFKDCAGLLNDMCALSHAASCDSEVAAVALDLLLNLTVNPERNETADIDLASQIARDTRL